MIRVCIRFLVAIVLLCSFSTTLNGQTKRIILLEKSFSGIDLKYSKYIDFDKGDTSYAVWIGFQNARYSSITDIKSIYLDQSLQVSEFKNDLIASFKQQDLKEKASMTWSKPEYEIHLSESNYLQLGDKDGRGYCFLPRKIGEKILSALNRIQFGQDQLFPESK